MAFLGQWARTYNNEEYLVHQNNNLGVAVFATDTDLRLLAQASMVYVDGTFRTAPHPYTQFFTIHGEVNSFVMKLACGLLSHKNAQSYEEVFRAISTRILNLTGQQWLLQEIVTDYEQAIINAVRIVFPGVSVLGNMALYLAVSPGKRIPPWPVVKAAHPQSNGDQLPSDPHFEDELAEFAPNSKQLSPRQPVPSVAKIFCVLSNDMVEC